ncbi:terminase small subunit [Fibrisoma montanum]|uniref:Terminase small subunit n=2 Tax=Fibrisoma montanum TaxID=2305895 RepID=A0A418MB91_9BACT|nr:terminase small subunit [Fibrisoma montanum]
MDQPEQTPLDILTTRQRRFVEAYIDCGNATRAAKTAGYSEKTAYASGAENLRKPQIKAAINYLGEQLGMSAGEAFKQMADIAKTRLNDFLIIHKVLKTPTVRKPLQQLINELDAEMEFEEEFARLAGLAGKDLDAHKIEQKKRELQGIRYALELERNPSAYRDVPGEAVWVDEVTVDLVKLARAKAEGRIKSLSWTEHGPKIELYAADAALDKILQLHGRYKQVPGDAGGKPRAVYTLPDGTTLEF